MLDIARGAYFYINLMQGINKALCKYTVASLFSDGLHICYGMVLTLVAFMH